MEYLEVARIIKPHGLTGEVGVLMHWNDSDVLQRIEHVRLQRPDGTVSDHAITRVRKSGQGYLVGFSGISDRNAAEVFRDAVVLVDRTLLPAAAPGEAYLADLIGREVIGPGGEVLGRVIEVSSYPSVDSLVIELPNGRRVEQPLVDDWVEPLDTAPNRVILRSLEGIVGP